MTASTAKMLVVEDDPVTRELLEAYFTNEGFEVFTLSDSNGCEDAVREKAIDICLVDIKIPGRDGLTLTHDIRAISSVGIILVTSKDDLIDRIVGLESGADDYVTKPFELRELLSRVKNVIRRTQETSLATQARNWAFGDWVLDVNKRSLVCPDGSHTSLSEGEYQLLLTLVENFGQVMTRDQLMNKIRNRDWHPDDRYVDVLVVKLRQKFKQHSPRETFISTIHGKGYLFEVTANLC